MKNIDRRTFMQILGISSSFSLFSSSFALETKIQPKSTRKIDISQFDKVLLPREHGQLTSMIKPLTRRYPSREHCMQMAAFFNEKKGMLVIANDPEGGTADWHIQPNSTLSINFYETKPDVLVIDIEPTIEAAAQVYKEWAVKQFWIQGRKRASPKLNFVSVASSSSIALEKKHLNQVLGAVDGTIGVWLTQWRSNPFDRKYPDYTPKEPAELAKFFSYIADNRGLAFPYLNGLLWDRELKSFHSRGERIAARTVQQKTIAYNRKLDFLNYACPYTPEWQDKIVNARNSLKGIDGQLTGGVYLDMLAAVGPMACWAPDHGHEPGGYDAWRRGVRELLKKINGLIMIEGCAEVYMDLFDYPLMHLYTDKDDTVNLWNLVYGDYVQALGWRLPKGVGHLQFEKALYESRAAGLKSYASPWMVSEPESALFKRQLIDYSTKSKTKTSLDTRSKE